jgi:hypothetical protein
VKKSPIISDPYSYIQEQRKNQQWWPLPADYDTLTVDGQKKARLATLSNQKRPIDLVAAWDLFRRLYLLTTPRGAFYHDYYPSPPFHYEALYDCGSYHLNVMAAPRGSAKSTVIGTELPLLLLLTRPYYRLILSLATDKMIEARFDRIMNQFAENEAIIDDFGQMKPKRGDAIYNRHHLQLNNGSMMQGFSVTGRKRGARPDMLIFDDPEYDPETDSDESTDILKEKFESLLFKQIIPMLEKNSSIFWIGTMIGRRSFLYHATASEDKRFDYWNRKVFQSVQMDPNDATKKLVLWDGKWDLKTLESRRAQIGESAWMSEYQNDPTSSQERVLRIDEKKNEYIVPDYTDPVHTELPLESGATVFYHDYDPEKRVWIPKEQKASELYDGLFRIITFDPAKGLGAHSDYSSIMVTGFDSRNCLWILDHWMGRAQELVLLNHIYKLGMKWKPKVVGIESIAMQISIVDSMNTLLDERKSEGWMPQVVPVDYTSDRSARRRKKADRITTLEWRFPAGKIKLPHHLSEKWPVKELYNQIRDFTYDMMLLRFDDAIDSVAMTNYIVHGRGATNFPTTEEPDLEQHIRDGSTMIAGVPRISGMNAEEIPRGVVQAIVDRAYVAGHHGQPDPNKKKSRPYYRVRRPRRQERKHVL